LTYRTRPGLVAF